MTDLELLTAARKGDINAFQQLFAAFQPQLKSFLYRMTTDRLDAEDLSQDTFVKAFSNIKQFREEASLKTWVFRIGANLARDLLRQRNRWPTDAQDQAKQLAMGSPNIQHAFLQTHQTSQQGTYDIREHIDFCFTCIGKTLAIDQQVAIILKDVYQFKRREITQVLLVSEGVVKHLLHDARKTMTNVFQQRCALVNKNGTCHQCTELAGIYNPRQARQAHLRSIKLVNAAENNAEQDFLYKLRASLVSFIDPLQSAGADLQDVIMQCTRVAIGEKKNLA